MNDRERSDLSQLKAEFLNGGVSRRDFLKRAAGLGISVTAAAAALHNVSFTGAQAATPAAPGAAPTGTLTIANAEPPTSAQWDSYTVFGLVDAQVASLVHDSLLGYDTADGKIVGHLATAWEQTD